jgi:hypothetical protein
MTNYSQPADEIKSIIRKGYPDGLDSSTAAKHISVLAARVNELERALIPFVKVGSSPNYGDTMVSVLFKNCADAANVMDRTQSIPVGSKVETFTPAEY